jgi:hypothetical protein
MGYMLYGFGPERGRDAGCWKILGREEDGLCILNSKEFLFLELVRRRHLCKEAAGMLPLLERGTSSVWPDRA